MDNRSFNFTSLDTIIDRILRHPLLKDTNVDDILFYTLDVLRLVNCPGIYVEKSCIKDIVDYKGLLPEEHSSIKTIDLVLGQERVPMVLATDSLHNQLDKLPKRNTSNTYTYTFNGCNLRTNVKEGQVFITYDALLTDDKGMPMIPNNVKLHKAIESYVQSQIFRVLADMDKISRNTAEKAEQEYNWYIGGAQTSMQAFKNEDDVESFLRDFKRLFIINRSHSTRNRFNVDGETRLKLW